MAKKLKPTPDQYRIVQEIISAIADCSAKSMSLMGPAGSGKTFTLSFLSEEIMNTWGKEAVVFIAPTHKAAREIRVKLPKGMLRPGGVTTIHSFVGSSSKRVRDEEQFSDPDVDDIHRKAAKLNPSLKAVVVDESSMVSQEYADFVDQVCQHANEMRGQDILVIYTGDPYQLPPISKKKGADNEGTYSGDLEYSPHMCDQFTSNEFNLRLTEVLRHDGKIFEIATSIRKNFKGDNTLAGLDGISGGSRINAYQDEFEWKRDLVEEIRKNPANAKALCFMNSNCKELTKFVRRKIYGKEAAFSWIQGERIIFPKYTSTINPGPNHVSNSNSKIHSCTSATVETCEIEENLLFVLGPFDYVTPKLKIERTFEEHVYCDVQRLVVMTDLGYRHHLVCPTFAAEPKFREQVSSLRGKISRLEKDGHICSNHELWTQIQQMKECLPAIYSDNVMTVHNSQGSTFEKVFLHRDVEQCRSDFRNSLLYVALTRASKAVYPLV
jgi:exodeoxyribonuclease V